MEREVTPCGNSPDPRSSTPYSVQHLHSSHLASQLGSDRGFGRPERIISDRGRGFKADSLMGTEYGGRVRRRAGGQQGGYCINLIQARLGRQAWPR